MSIIKPPFYTGLNLGHRLSQGLVGVWLFNEAPPALGTALDLSGNGKHGTLVADTHSVPGMFGNALDFDGTGDYVLTAHSFNGLAAFTIQAWVKRRNDTHFDVVVGASDGTVDFYFGFDNSSAMRTSVPTTSGTVNFERAIVGSEDWRAISLVYDGVNVTFYYDSVFVDATAQTGTVTVNNPTRLADRGNGTLQLDGQIGTVTIWHRALSASEIASLYTKPFQMLERGS